MRIRTPNLYVIPNPIRCRLSELEDRLTKTRCERLTRFAFEGEEGRQGDGMVGREKGRAEG